MSDQPGRETTLAEPQTCPYCVGVIGGAAPWGCDCIVTSPARDTTSE